MAKFLDYQSQLSAPLRALLRDEVEGFSHGGSGIGFLFA